MAYQFDNLKLEKGMYHEAGKSFTQVLESMDPDQQYKGTALEGLDAFQRQLKRFDIKVKGAGSDVVEKFFRSADYGLQAIKTRRVEHTDSNIFFFANPF